MSKYYDHLSICVVGSNGICMQKLEGYNWKVLAVACCDFVKISKLCLNITAQWVNCFQGVSKHCLFWCFKGNVMNGPIGKQMVDTLVESSGNVEVRNLRLCTDSYALTMKWLQAVSIASVFLLRLCIDTCLSRRTIGPLIKSSMQLFFSLAWLKEQLREQKG